MVGVVEELAALGLPLGQAAGRDLQVLHLAAHLEALEYVARRREVELLLFSFDVFVLFGRFRFLRASDAGVAFEAFPGAKVILMLMLFRQ